MGSKKEIIKAVVKKAVKVAVAIAKGGVISTIPVFVDKKK